MGGTITEVRRSDGRNDLWVVSVQPDSHHAVTITLPGGRLRHEAAPSDPAPLANSPSATVEAGSFSLPELCSGSGA